MKKLAATILLIVHFVFAAYSQDTTISKFVPKGYSVLNFTKGDLNLDRIDDAILVLNKKGEDSISSNEKPVKRNFLILIGQPGKSYKPAFHNENVVYYYRYDPNFLDAFAGVSIEKGHFSIDHYGGFAHRWGRTTTFEFDPSANNWFLSEDEYNTMDATNSEEPNKTLSEKKADEKRLRENTF